MKHTPVGIDIAKHVFQVHFVDTTTGEVVNRTLRRSGFLRYFANRTPCLIGMEACSGAHHWARELHKQGHEVRLLPGRFVKAFNPGNKTDLRDARAIWLAVQQPCKAVAVKSEAQQAVLCLHRIREQLRDQRTQQVNQLRGLLAEFGEVMGTGRVAFKRELPEVLARLSERLPQMVVEAFQAQSARITRLDGEIAQVEGELQAWMRENASAQAIARIPGIGLLTATAAVATMGDARTFRNGREFAAWIGLVPRQVGTGGRVKLLGISKRGDRYLRTLLIHGARSVLRCAGDEGWLGALRQRRCANVAAVALANKMARTLWAILAHGRAYSRTWMEEQAQVA